jgi:hypothetical protein
MVALSLFFAFFEISGEDEREQVQGTREYL